MRTNLPVGCRVDRGGDFWNHNGLVVAPNSWSSCVEEDEVDDGLYRTVASFALIADRLIAHIKEGRTDEYVNDIHDQPHFLLVQLQEAPFYAFPNGDTLAHAISIADQLSRILQRRSSAATIVAKHDANDQVHLHQAIKAIEGELHLLRVAAVHWAPTYKGVAYSEVAGSCLAPCNWTIVKRCRRSRGSPQEAVSMCLLVLGYLLTRGQSWQCRSVLPGLV